MSHDWMVVANASHARIFKVSSVIGKPRQIKLIQEIEHPQSRMKKKDLLSDKPGIYKAGGFSTGGHPQDLQNIEIDRFAKELADIIDYARTLNRFERLIIVAPSHFYGLLEKHLLGSIKYLIKSVIQKDYTAVVERDLQRLIFPRRSVSLKITENT